MADETTLRSTNAEVAVARVPVQIQDLKFVAAACADFNALSKVSFPVNQMQLRGYGGSVVRTTDRAAFSLDNYMSDIDVVIGSTERESGPSRSVLFGYSHAGYFTTAYAIGNPQKVSALILVEPALYTDREELLKRIDLATKEEGLESIEAMLRYVDPGAAMRSDARETARSITSNVNSNMTLIEEFRLRADSPISDDSLALLQMPVLLIGGTHSRVNWMVKRAAQAIPYASVAWIRGATHLSLQNEEYADDIASVVNCFAKQLA